MKKIYKKPELFYENFSLMEAIATCTVITDTKDDKSVCAYYDEGFGELIFVDGNSGCEIDANYYGVAFDNVFPS